MNLPAAKNQAEGNIDQIVLRNFFSDEKSGVFVEVGAARPDFLSISALYRSKGWRIIAVEPNPAFCEMQIKAGNNVLQYACGDHDEDDVDFTIGDQHGAEHSGDRVTFESFSSLGIKDEYATLQQKFDTKTIKVQLRKLDTIMANHAPDVERIDILCVDVEGWEIEVLRGLDFGRHRPRVMIIENLFQSIRYISYINKNGYKLWRRSFPNDIYVETDSPLWIRKISSITVHLFYWTKIKLWLFRRRLRSLLPCRSN